MKDAQAQMAAVQVGNVKIIENYNVTLTQQTFT